jgi:uncharacterized membrane protein YbhN (UPF0104 family)
VVAVGIALATTHAGRGTLDRAVVSLARAQPGWLCAAAAAFAAGLLCSAAAWRTGLRACGGTAGYAETSARYAVGSLVNTLAPAHVGGALRLALFAQTLPKGDRAWRVAGVGAAIAAARTASLAVLVVAAAGWGGIPWWPAPTLAVIAGGAIVFCAKGSRRARGRLSRALEVFRVLRGCPRKAALLAGWIVASFAARVVAAAAIVVALGIPRPVWAAIVLLGAIALAGIVPVTPGNFGAGAGAATLALHGTGVGLGPSLATGVAFQAVESFAGVVLGLAGVAVLAPPSQARRWALAGAGAAAVLVATVLGVVSADLV